MNTKSIRQPIEISLVTLLDDPLNRRMDDDRRNRGTDSELFQATPMTPEDATASHTAILRLGGESLHELLHRQELFQAHRFIDRLLAKGNRQGLQLWTDLLNGLPQILHYTTLVQLLAIKGTNIEIISKHLMPSFQSKTKAIAPAVRTKAPERRGEAGMLLKRGSIQ
jgi:hypothetical protein